MDPRSTARRSVGVGIRLSRGTADAAFRVAGPRMAALVGELTSRLRRGGDGGRPTTQTFTPSKPTAKAPGPSPATIAGNIAPKRPTARAAKPAARPSVPGAKLPPRRQRTT